MDLKRCKKCLGCKVRMSNYGVANSFLNGFKIECCQCDYKTEVAETIEEAVELWNTPPVKKSPMEQLVIEFLGAIEHNVPYIAVVVEMEGFEKPEIIINQRENFEKKLEYYKSAYNDYLTLKSFNGIKIVDFESGDDFEVLEMNLKF